MMFQKRGGFGILGLGVIGLIGLLVGCDAIDPQRPASLGDTVVFGNLLGLEEAEATDTWVVQMRAGVPRILTQAQEAAGELAQVMEKGIDAEVTVGPDTVVLVGGRPAGLDDLAAGTEVAAMPVAGTTRMVGQAILMEAAFFMDFTTYQKWMRPKLGDQAPPEPAEYVGDKTRINTPGMEHAPVPVAGGRVLYFAASLRPLFQPKGEWAGARREGLPEPEEGQISSERTYRTEHDGGTWTAPELVAFPNLADALMVRVTWVAEDEQDCLVTVLEEAAAGPWVGAAVRDGEGWGKVERMAALGEGDAADSVFLAGSKTKVAFVSRRTGMGNDEIMLYDPAADDPAAGEIPVPIDARVNTLGREWCPRVGPDNELLFCRDDRQLILAAGVVRSLRVGGPHRLMMTEANPTRDAQWMFFCLPKFTPIEMDQDIYVAKWNHDGTLGPHQPVDEWDPAPPGAISD